MKLVIIFGMIAAIFLATSCKKELLSGNDIPTIVGRWNVITDSTFSGAGAGNHPVNLTGQRGDYFDFRADGNVYIKEGATLDKLSYLLTSDTTIVIKSFGGIVLNGVPETSFITNLTIHSVTITAPFLYTPGGAFGRKVSLDK